MDNILQCFYSILHCSTTNLSLLIALFIHRKSSSMIQFLLKGKMKMVASWKYCTWLGGSQGLNNQGLFVNLQKYSLLWRSPKSVLLLKITLFSSPFIHFRMIFVYFACSTMLSVDISLTSEEWIWIKQLEWMIFFSIKMLQWFATKLCNYWLSCFKEKSNYRFPPYRGRFISAPHMVHCRHYSRAFAMYLQPLAASSFSLLLDFHSWFLSSVWLSNTSIVIFCVQL